MATLNRLRIYQSFLLYAIATGLAACGNNEPISAPQPGNAPAPMATPSTVASPASTPAVDVTEVDLGSAVGSDMGITIPSKNLKSGDTIYAAVALEGHGNDIAVKTRWKYQDGSVVNTSTQMLSNLAGHNVTDFHITNPAGWPAGKYTVEVSINEKIVSTSDFTVIQ